MSAAGDRWPDSQIKERTTDTLDSQDGRVFDAGRAKFEIDFSSEDISRNTTLAAQTSKSILESHGYIVFYAHRNESKTRDPKRLIAVITSSATPVKTG